MQEQLCSRCFYFNALAPALAESMETRAEQKSKAGRSLAETKEGLLIFFATQMKQNERRSLRLAVNRGHVAAGADASPSSELSPLRALVGDLHILPFAVESDGNEMK